MRSSIGQNAAHARLVAPRLRSKVATPLPWGHAGPLRSTSFALDPLSEITNSTEAERRASESQASTSGRGQVPSDASYLEFPTRATSKDQSSPQKVRVRLSVHYRVHSRQLLCIGGSQLPFGWSFLSIANVPMEWNPGDVWTTEVFVIMLDNKKPNDDLKTSVSAVELPVGQRIDYKYVILEEQDWTIQVSKDAEGLVTFEYRTRPEGPPNVQQIQKQMAIVAWQPGPNRYVQVPSQEEVDSLQPGEVREREPARAPKQNQISRTYGQQAKGGQNPSVSDMSLPLLARVAIANRGQRVGSSNQESDEMAGTWENLSFDSDGVPLLERRDVWGLAGEDLGMDAGQLKPESES